MATAKKDLEYFGDGMQYRFVKHLIENPDSFVEIEPYVNPKNFSDEGLVSIITVMKDFFEEKGRTPSYHDLEYHLKDIINDQDRLDKTYSAFCKIKNEKELEDGMETASEIGMKYVKEKEVIKQLENAKASFKNSGYSQERLERVLEGLENIEGASNASYVTPMSKFDEIMSEENAERVCSGVIPLDKAMKGGLARGTTGLLIAGTGVGKTTLFSIMACGSAIQGNNVLYVFFEDKDTDFCRKFYSNITGLPTDSFHADSPDKTKAENMVRDYLREHEDVRKAFTHNVRAMRLPNGETTVEQLKSKIRSMIAKGWKPDIVFLDYIQCMKSSTDNKMSIEKEFATLDRCMKRLDSFAQEQNFALWVAQQTNRDGAKKESSDRIGNVQGSFRLCQTASAILYLERDHDTEELDFNAINLYLDKMRGASVAKWIHTYMNNGTCQLDLNRGEFITGEPTDADYLNRKKEGTFPNDKAPAECQACQDENRDF